MKKQEIKKIIRKIFKEKVFCSNCKIGKCDTGNFENQKDCNHYKVEKEVIEWMEFINTDLCDALKREIKLHDKAASFVKEIKKRMVFHDEKIDVEQKILKKMQALISQLNYPVKENNKIL